MLDHRLQILLDETRFNKISVEAKRRGVSVASVIRDAIDQLAATADARRTAVDAILSAPTMAVPDDPAHLRRELDDAHDRLARVTATRRP
jgi:hypothetical protein